MAGARLFGAGCDEGNCVLGIAGARLSKEGCEVVLDGTAALLGSIAGPDDGYLVGEVVGTALPVVGTFVFKVVGRKGRVGGELAGEVVGGAWLVMGLIGLAETKFVGTVDIAEGCWAIGFDAEGRGLWACGAPCLLVTAGELEVGKENETDPEKLPSCNKERQYHDSSSGTSCIPAAAMGLGKKSHIATAKALVTFIV
jgi:hypothetical protein